MKFVSKYKIKSDRLLSDLDKRVLKFVKILESHTDYVVVGSYAAILLGRSRATDVVAVLVPILNESKFNILYRNLVRHGY